MRELISEVYYPDAPGRYRYLIKTPAHLLQHQQRQRIVQSTKPLSIARKGIVNTVIASIVHRAGKEVNSETMREYMAIADPSLFRITDVSGKPLSEEDKKIIVYYHPNFYKQKPKFKPSRFEKAFDQWVQND